MMKKKLLKYYGLLLVSGLGSALLLLSCDNKMTIEPRQEDTFIRLYGRQYNDQAIDMIRLDDGRIVMLCASAVRDAQEGEQAPRDVSLIFIDENGNEASYYFKDDDENQSVDELPTSLKRFGDDLYFSGIARSGSNSDMLLGKFSLSSMSYEWLNTYDKSSQDEAYDLDISFEGNILLVGNRDNNVQLYQIDPLTGTVVKDEDPGDNLDSKIIKIITQPDSTPILHYLYEGEDSQTGESEIVIENVPYELTLKSAVPNPSDEIGNDIPVDMIDLGVTGNIGRLIILGYFQGAGENIESILILEARYDLPSGGDISGTTDNDNGFTPHTIINTSGILPHSIIQTNDGGFAILGKDLLDYMNGGGIVLIKLDQSFNEEWRRKFGTGEFIDSPGAILQDDQSNYFINSTVSFNESETNTKIGLFKTDMMGNLDF